MTEEEEVVKEDKLSTRFWNTFRSRFKASQRLARESFIHLLTLTIASVATIVIPFLNDKLPNTIEVNVDIFTFTMSILIICYSLIIFAIDPSKNSTLLYLSAMEIEQLNDSYLYNKNTISEERKKELFELREKTITKYHHILSRYNVNHTSIDYKNITSTDKLDKCTDKLDKCFYWILYHFWVICDIFIIICIVFVPFLKFK